MVETFLGQIILSYTQLQPDLAIFPILQPSDAHKLHLSMLHLFKFMNSIVGGNKIPINIVKLLFEFHEHQVGKHQFVKNQPISSTHIEGKREAFALNFLYL